MIMNVSLRLRYLIFDRLLEPHTLSWRSRTSTARTDHDKIHNALLKITIRALRKIEAHTGIPAHTWA